MNIPKEINFKFTSCKLSHKVKINLFVTKDEKIKCLQLIFFFPTDFVTILSYTTQNYWSKFSYSRNYIDELYIQASRKDITLKSTVQSQGLKKMLKGSSLTTRWWIKTWTLYFSKNWWSGQRETIELIEENDENCWWWEHKLVRA